MVRQLIFGPSHSIRMNEWECPAKPDLLSQALKYLNLPMFKMTHPILGTRDIKRAIEFYTQRLGFQLAFGDKTDPPNYVGFRRDAVELHMQFQFEHEMGTIRLRFLVEDPDTLFNE